MSLDQPDLRDVIYLAIRNAMMGKDDEHPFGIVDIGKVSAVNTLDRATDGIMALVKDGMLVWDEHGIPLYDEKLDTDAEGNQCREDLLCTCGHSYYRHFDSYEDMRAVGCKYCSCLIPDLTPIPEVIVTLAQAEAALAGLELAYLDGFKEHPRHDEVVKAIRGFADHHIDQADNYDKAVQEASGLRRRISAMAKDDLKGLLS